MKIIKICCTSLIHPRCSSIAIDLNRFQVKNKREKREGKKEGKKEKKRVPSNGKKCNGKNNKQSRGKKSLKSS